MTTVRIAHAETHFDPGPDGTTAARRILVVLADDPGHRAMGLWLPPARPWAYGRSRAARPATAARPRPSAMRHRATCRSGSSPSRIWPAGCWAAGAAVTGVDIDELGPGVLAAQIGVAGPAGPWQVIAPPGSALALAAALEAPVRVADALMDRLAVPVTGDDLPGLFASRAPAPRPGRATGRGTWPSPMAWTAGSSAAAPGLRSPGRTGMTTR